MAFVGIDHQVVVYLFADSGFIDYDLKRVLTRTNLPEQLSSSWSSASRSTSRSSAPSHGRISGSTSWSRAARHVAARLRRSDL